MVCSLSGAGNGREPRDTPGAKAQLHFPLSSNYRLLYCVGWPGEMSLKCAQEAVTNASISIIKVLELGHESSNRGGCH
jgi:hypothetical protein